MRLGKEVKRDTQLIIISVLVLTLVTLSVSYSAFFSVQSQSTIQEISTGTLDVVIDSTSSAMSTEDLFPTATSDLPTAANSVVDSGEGTYATLILKNSGTLDADFSVTIGYDSLPSGKTTDDLIAMNYLTIGIFDVDNNSWVDFGSGVYNTPITGLTATDTNVYPILRDTISKSSNGTATTREFRVYVWLSEDTPTTEIGKLVYMKLDVKSTTVSES